MDNKVVTREEIKEFENELKKRWFIIEEPKSVIEIIENFEEFLVADFGQKDWDENFLKQHFKILKDSVKEFQDEQKEKTYDKIIISDLKTAEQIEIVFKQWSQRMDEIYGEEGEDRNNAPMWSGDNPAEWMKPYDDNLFTLWCDWDGEIACMIDIKEYIDQK